VKVGGARRKSLAITFLPLEHSDIVSLANDA